MGRSKQFNHKRDAARRQQDEADGIVRHPPARSFLYPTRDRYQSIFRILPSDDPEILEFEMISDRFPHDLPPWRRFDFRRDRPPPNHGRERWKEIVAVPDGPPRVLSNGPVRVTRVPQMQVPLSQGQGDSTGTGMVPFAQSPAAATSGSTPTAQSTAAAAVAASGTVSSTLSTMMPTVHTARASPLVTSSTVPLLAAAAEPYSHGLPSQSNQLTFSDGGISGDGSVLDVSVVEASQHHDPWRQYERKLFEWDLGRNTPMFWFPYNKFNEWIQCEYVTPDDVDQLREFGWLLDRLVSLLTRYFYGCASEHVKRRVFLFRPQWMFFLGRNDIAIVSRTVNFHSGGRDPFDSLLVAPMLVNANHWAVVVGVNLDKLVHRPTALPARPDVADPPIFIVFDSGTNYRTYTPTATRYPALVGLNRYLRQRAIDDPSAHALNDRYMLHDAWRDQPFFATGSNFSQASWPIVVMAEMPLQRDGYNCGMHAVQCVRTILERDLDFLREICRLPVGRMFRSIDQTLFRHENMSVLRLEFLKLIMNLMDQCTAYCKDRISIQQREIILNRVHAHDLAVAQQFAEVYQQQLRDDPEVFLPDLDFE
ncbi:hypothetical protein AMAG_07230 [Allomyces macrogynus ATCC 38327]|uniref:Ubiquitin-like protease family profile domain-containing protein n=1 Tax=Allomyces macrogynus (strain ATCC 38327) TaxID=578462 RepID=A0A0L0SHQ2_ALLM3|nr:hypothetical protein AMAG_07230 [Allomyces macrogynus ATCC 38327]|eukprot:KNE61964.1 hypothetical protein AMAG_07230 [Allomyces macrogynus ATCC 38327]